MSDPAKAGGATKDGDDDRHQKMLTYYGGLVTIAIVIWFSFDDNASDLLPFLPKEYLDKMLAPVVWARESYRNDATGWLFFYERNLRPVCLALYSIHGANNGVFSDEAPWVHYLWSYVLFRSLLLGDVVRDFLFFFGSGDIDFLWDMNKTAQFLWYTQIWCLSYFDPYQILHNTAQHEDVKAIFQNTEALWLVRHYFSCGAFQYRGWILSFPEQYELCFIAEYLTTMLPNLISRQWKGVGAADIGRSLVSPGWEMANHMHEVLIYMLIWHHPFTQLFQHDTHNVSDGLLYSTTEFVPGNGEMLKAVSQWCGLWMVFHERVIGSYTVNPIAEQAAKAVSPQVESIVGTPLATAAD